MTTKETENMVISLDPTILRPNRHNPNRMSDEALHAMELRFRRQQCVDKPITARVVTGEDGNVFYEIIDGEQTTKAAIAADLKQVPVIIREKAAKSNTIAIVDMIVLNHHGQVCPLALGRAIREAMRAYKEQTNKELSGRSIAERLGKSEASVRNVLGFCEVADYHASADSDGWINRVDGEQWPTEVEVSQLTVSQMRGWLDRIPKRKEGNAGVASDDQGDLADMFSSDGVLEDSVSAKRAEEKREKAEEKKKLSAVKALSNQSDRLKAICIFKWSEAVADMANGDDIPYHRKEYIIKTIAAGLSKTDRASLMKELGKLRATRETAE